MRRFFRAMVFSALLGGVGFFSGNALAFDKTQFEYLGTATLSYHVTAATTGGSAIVFLNDEKKIAILAGSTRVDGALTGPLVYTLFGNVDPEILTTISVTNPANEPIRFTMFVDLNTEPFDAVNWTVRGYFDATVTDINGGGASVTPVQQFFPDDPLQPPVNVFLAGHKNRVIGPGIVAFGGNLIPGLGNAALGPGHTVLDTGMLTMAAPPGAQFNDMTLELAFDLSPGDSAVISAGVQVGSTVPEPASALLLLPLAGMLGRRPARGQRA